MSLMLREIFEQPKALEKTLKEERSHAEAFSRFLNGANIPLVVLVARGSSDNAALFDRYLIELQTGIPVSLAAPSVHTVYRAEMKLDGALVVGVSQSGESTDVNIVLQRAKKKGAFTVGVTNDPRSSMAHIADETFLIKAGEEKSVAATKTFTGQLLIFYLIAEALKRKPDFRRLDHLPALAAEALKLDSRVQEIAERFRFMNQCAVVSRGLTYADAYEMAIKLMETCYVVAERFSSADFQHGPVAMVEKDFPTFLLAPRGKSFPDLLNLAKKLKDLQSESVIISGEDRILKHATCPIKMPKRIDEFMAPIPYIIPGQLLAARLAAIKGINPDQPRTLSKVTKTI